MTGNGQYIQNISGKRIVEAKPSPSPFYPWTNDLLSEGPNFIENAIQELKLFRMQLQKENEEEFDPEKYIARLLSKHDE